MSLIELLVLVAILAIVATIGVLGLSGAGGEREVEREARRLHALIALACERAQLGGREHGIEFAIDRYGFVLAATDCWQPIRAGELTTRILPKPIRLEVRRDERAFSLGIDMLDEPQVLCSPNGEITEFDARLAAPDGASAWVVRVAADGGLVVVHEEDRR